MTRAQESAELRPGLPPVELRRVHKLWRPARGGQIQFSSDGLSFDWTIASDGYKWPFEYWSLVSNMRGPGLDAFAPVGASWSEVEALAAKGGG